MVPPAFPPISLHMSSLRIMVINFVLWPQYSYLPGVSSTWTYNLCIGDKPANLLVTIVLSLINLCTS